MRSNMRRSVSFIVGLGLLAFLGLDFVSFEVLIFSLELGNFVSELGDLCLGRLKVLLEFFLSALKSNDISL
jgi:hypothetical protein